ncbi:MAG: biotin transporter BioY [Elusimicrobiales bacterium]
MNNSQATSIKNINTDILKISGIVIFTILLILSSQIKIYMLSNPVPFTLQTAVVFLSCIFLGKSAYISALIYAAPGFAGINWFAAITSSILYSPTLGYIIGFIIASYIGGRFFEKNNFKRLSDYFLFFISVEVPIYISGIMWLKIFTGLSLINTIRVGFLPFIAWDLLKYILVIPVINIKK